MFFRLTIIVSHVFITVSLCDVRLSHLNKDYLLTDLLTRAYHKPSKSAPPIPTMMIDSGNAEACKQYTNVWNCSCKFFLCPVLRNCSKIFLLRKWADLLQCFDAVGWAAERQPNANDTRTRNRYRKPVGYQKTCTGFLQVCHANRYRFFPVPKSGTE